MIWQENRENAYCEITPAIMALKEQWEAENYIDPRLYKGRADGPDPCGGDSVLYRDRG